MPREFVDCVNALLREGKSKDSAYAICTDAFKKRHGGKTPQEMESKHTLDITIDSLEGIERVEIKQADKQKGVSIVLNGDKIIQYQFDLLNEAGWTEETALGYIKKREEEVMQSELSCDLSLMDIKQASFLPEDKLNALKSVDPNPYFGVLKVKYGEGSNKQYFDKAFFQKAGAKFEGKTFFLNHSDLTEFGKATPIGSIVKFLGVQDDGAEYAFYISAAEGVLRQKLRESKALGDLGFVKKVSIEGIPKKGDYTIDEKTGIKYFQDLAYPSGIAIVNLEGLKGSQIIA